MEEQLISFETAKLAKEKGFKPDREWNPTYVTGYREEGELSEFQEEDWDIEGNFLAPSQSILQKWLREKKEIDVLVLKKLRKYELGECYRCTVAEFTAGGDAGEFDTYEKALELGLQEALKLIKS